jgi:hypothetical protein
MTAKRKSISKKVRFEVFKRDKFQCQYCGKSAPDVVLNVDHIDPVANGGSNDLVNLITSCFDCNQGKKARLLSDDTLVQKQRRQLELLQERREQLELMLEWKKSLTDFDTEKVTMVSDYWASLMEPFSLNENGQKSLDQLMKKFPLEDILEAIDIANEKYLRYDNEGNIVKESVEEAFNKVGGICALKNMPKINQKLAYVKGICKNRFSYWDARKGSIILNNYINALKNYGWTEEQIINDVENEVIPQTKECSNWSQWKNLLEKWTDDVNGWGNETDSEPDNLDSTPKELSLDTLETYSNVIIGETKDRLEALRYLGKVFPEFNEKALTENVKKEALVVLDTSGAHREDVQGFTENSKSYSLFQIPEPYPENLGFLMVLESSALEYLVDIFDSYNLNSSNYTDKDKVLLKNMILERINNIA